MTTYIIYADSTDGWIQSYAPSYSNARYATGSTMAVDTTNTVMHTGQNTDSNGNKWVHQSFMSFPTSVIADADVVVDAALSIYSGWTANNQTQVWGQQFYQHAWTAPLTTAQWVNPDTLQSQNWIANIDYLNPSTPYQTRYTAHDNLISAISTTTDLKVLSISNRTVGNNAPVGTEEIWTYTGDNSTNKPCLTVYTTQLTTLNMVQNASCSLPDGTTISLRSNGTANATITIGSTSLGASAAWTQIGTLDPTFHNGISGRNTVTVLGDPSGNFYVLGLAYGTKNVIAGQAWIKSGSTWVSGGIIKGTLPIGNEQTVRSIAAVYQPGGTDKYDFASIYCIVGRGGSGNRAAYSTHVGGAGFAHDMTLSVPNLKAGSGNLINAVTNGFAYSSDIGTPAFVDMAPMGPNLNAVYVQRGAFGSATVGGIAVMGVYGGGAIIDAWDNTYYPTGASQLVGIDSTKFAHVYDDISGSQLMVRFYNAKAQILGYATLPYSKFYGGSVGTQFDAYYDRSANLLRVYYVDAAANTTISRLDVSPVTFATASTIGEFTGISGSMPTNPAIRIATGLPVDERRVQIDVSTAVTSRTNLDPNPSFEGTSGYAVARTNLSPDPRATGSSAGVWGTDFGGGNGTINYSNTDATYGNYARQTWTVASTSSVCGQWGSRFNVTAGETYVWSAYVRASIAQTMTLGVDWRNSSGTIIAQSRVPAQAVAANTWTRISQSAVAPAGAVNGTITYFGSTGAALWPVNATLDITQTLIEVGSVVGTYFYGATAASGDFIYAWDTTADSSTSHAFAPALTNVTIPTTSNAWQSSDWATAAGKHSVRVSPYTATTNDSYVSPGGDTGGMRVGLVAGNTYTISGTCYVGTAQTGTLNARARTIQFFSLVSGSYNASASPAAANTNATATRVSVTATIPSTATEAFFRLYNGASVNGGDVYWDDILVEQVGSMGAYFDGSTAGVSRTNLCTNPSFESGITGWAANGGSSLATSTAQAWAGSNSGLVTYATNASNGSGGVNFQAALAASTTYTFSFYAYVSAGAPAVIGDVVGAGFTTQYTSPSSVTGQWQRLSMTFTTTTAQTYTFNITNNAATTAGQTFYVDGVLIEQSASLGTYIEGTKSFSHTWAGATNSSVSYESSASTTTSVYSTAGNAAPAAPVLVAHPNFDATTSTTFTWKFSDANLADTESTFDLEIYRVSDNTLIGSLYNGTGTTATLNANTISNGVNCQWRVRTYDLLGTQGAWSAYSTFSTAAVGTLAITDPAADNQTGIQTSSYNVAWTYTNSGGQTQAKSQVAVYRVSDGVKISDTGMVANTTAGATITGLASDTQYRIDVTVQNTGSVNSATVSRYITPSYATPMVPTLTISAMNSYNLIQITNPAPVGSRPEITYNDIYRRRNGVAGEQWVHIATVAKNAAYSDFAVRSNTAYDYYVTSRTS